MIKVMFYLTLNKEIESLFVEKIKGNFPVPIEAFSRIESMLLDCIAMLDHIAPDNAYQAWLIPAFENGSLELTFKIQEFICCTSYSVD